MTVFDVKQILLEWKVTHPGFRLPANDESVNQYAKLWFRKVGAHGAFTPQDLRLGAEAVELENRAPNLSSLIKHMTIVRTVRFEREAEQEKYNAQQAEQKLWEREDSSFGSTFFQGIQKCLATPNRRHRLEKFIRLCEFGAKNVPSEAQSFGKVRQGFEKELQLMGD